MTSLTVPSDFKPKDFWSRPEGKPGMILLAVIIGITLFYGWGVLVPFILTTLQDTFWAITYGISTLFILDIVFGITGFGKTMKNLIKNIFQSIARGIACCYTTIDPIGILRNDLDDARADKDKLDATVRRFSGSEEKLQRKIKEQTSQINLLGAEANKAKQMATTSRDPLEHNRLQLAAETSLEKAGMLMAGVKQLGDLEKETAGLLRTFQNWSQTADAKIERTKNRVDFLADQRAMILDAKSTLNVGMSLLKGKPEQLALVDNAIEYLAEDTARTLGEIHEFTRYTDKLYTADQIERGARADLAAASFAEFNQKLLSASTAPSGVDLLGSMGVATPQAVPVYNSAAAGGSSDGYDPFK